MKNIILIIICMFLIGCQTTSGQPNSLTKIGNALTKASVGMQQSTLEKNQHTPKVYVYDPTTKLMKRNNYETGEVKFYNTIPSN